jgi:hypothetical protein
MRVAATLCWLLLCFGLQAEAADGIRRCVGPDGGSIYTDRPCATFDAVDRLPDAPAGSNTLRPTSAPSTVRSDCVRRTDTLLFELRQAIESDDINQLAGLYHWPGISGRGARGIMERLQRVASRPLASVELVFPEITPVRDHPDAFPDCTPPEDPVGVRIAQTLPGEISPSFSADLRLVRHAECWWVAF